jgi:hypothetical protein
MWAIPSNTFKVRGEDVWAWWKVPPVRCGLLPTCSVKGEPPHKCIHVSCIDMFSLCRCMMHYVCCFVCLCLTCCVPCRLSKPFLLFVLFRKVSPMGECNDSLACSMPWARWDFFPNLWKWLMLEKLNDWMMDDWWWIDMLAGLLGHNLVAYMVEWSTPWRTLGTWYRFGNVHTLYIHSRYIHWTHDHNVMIKTGNCITWWHIWCYLTLWMGTCWVFCTVPSVTIFKTDVYMTGCDRTAFAD